MRSVRMFELLFHAGADHPNLAWIVVPSILTFIAGILVGRVSHHFNAFNRSESASQES